MTYLKHSTTHASFNARGMLWTALLLASATACGETPFDENTDGAPSDGGVVGADGAVVDQDAGTVETTPDLVPSIEQVNVYTERCFGLPLRDETRQLYLVTADRIGETVVRGYARFDMQVAEACFERVASLPCGATVPNCIQEAWIPLQQPGEPCLDSQECSNSYCEIGGACPGTCQPHVEPGGRCRATAMCPDGHSCVGEFCVTNIGREGDLCSTSSEATTKCPPELICVANPADGRRRCAAPAEAGRPCVDPFACADGLSCVDGSCKQSGGRGTYCVSHDACEPGMTCVDHDEDRSTPRQCEVAAGARCSFAQTCPGDYRCVDRMCVLRPAAGEDCSTHRKCRRGYRCDEETITCLPLLSGGTPCENPKACAEDLWCKDGECVPEGSLGDRCDRTVTCNEDFRCRYIACELGLVCVNSVCRLPGGAGASCVELADCMEGTRCSEETCQPLPTDSEPCLESRHCAEGHSCLDGTCAGFREAGELCGTFGDCLSGDCENGRCAALPGLGERCRNQCASGLYCPLGDGIRCVEQVPLGADCRSSRECIGDYSCVLGKCAASCL